MTDPALSIATRAARLLAERDRLAADLRRLDAALQAETTAYSQAVRTWGFTPTMLRQACVARGLLARED